MNEQDYLRGSRQAWMMILREALRNLDYEDPGARLAERFLERVEAVAELRRVCERYGDNDWPDEMNLADVIDKHLARHLEERTDG